MARRSASPAGAAPTQTRERSLWAQGVSRVAGVDEAGRGPLAGPVVAGAVALPDLDGADVEDLALIRDSKTLTPAQRERAAEVVRAAALDAAVGEASAQEIDAMGILPATRLAMRRALDGLSVAPDYLLVDGTSAVDWRGRPCLAIVKGDRLCTAIAAASIMAKTHRDALMRELDARYPGYGLAQHKGYASPAHLTAIAQHGPSPAHRRTFSPMRATLMPAAPPSPRSRLGAQGEEIAAAYLAVAGLRVAARNFRTRRGEVDIVAEDGETLVFVEVRTRRTASFGSPEESVTARKRQRVAVVAQEYLRQHGLESRPWRVDVVAVLAQRGTPEVRHYPNVEVSEPGTY
ncbi:MAG: ribonuclease HII [Chloroflexota bacterium]|nr:ribonuclease HII [Chloroflexota bacterium]